MQACTIVLILNVKDDKEGKQCQFDHWMSKKNHKYILYFTPPTHTPGGEGWGLRVRENSLLFLRLP